jgi:hypothetical protein
MAHVYSGINAPGSVLNPATFGVWSNATVTDDGDDRDAASAMAAAECALDRTNWLYHRTIDIISGGTFVVRGNVNIDAASSQVWNWKLPVNFYEDVACVNAMTLHIGFPLLGDASILLHGSSYISAPTGTAINLPGGFLVVTSSGGISLASGCTFVNSGLSTFNGAATFNSGVNLNGNTILDSGATFRQDGPHQKNGPAAVTKIRLGSIAAPDNDKTNLTITHLDLIEVEPMTTADRQWELANPSPTPDTDETIIVEMRPTSTAAGGKKLSLLDVNGVVIGGINFAGAGGLASLRLAWVDRGDGTRRWRVLFPQNADQSNVVWGVTGV